MVIKPDYFPVLILFKMFCSVRRYGIFGLSVEVSKEVNCYEGYEEKKIILKRPIYANEATLFKPGRHL